MCLIKGFVIISVVLHQVCQAQDHGPVFLQEPPSRLIFSNNTGASAPCSAHGFPPPSISWHLADGSLVSSIPGLRMPMDNGSLVFPGFPAQEYRQDVHGAVYRCRAANSVGVVLSRDMHVTAVVWQEYSVLISGTKASVGSTAVLSCVVPSSVRDYVAVNAWYKDDSMLLPGPPDTSGRYVVTGNKLHIRGVRSDDGAARYSCSTENTLTNERRRSNPVKLQVTENVGTSPPRITTPQVVDATIRRGGDIHISCAAEGNPTPTITWLHEVDGVFREVQPSLRISVTNDLLSVRRTEISDSGRWACRASNALGERTQETKLLVNTHLSAHLHPLLQIVNSGGTAVLNCTVGGDPPGAVQWLHDGVPVSGGIDSTGSDGRARLQGALALVLTSVRRSDAGMYQCIIRNEIESAQASAELRLGDTAPELQYTFIEQALRAGPTVSLRCSAAGAPPPHFSWLLDGQPLTAMSRGLRYQTGQYTLKNGDVVSHLNISSVRSEDGGLYSCRAANSLGEVTHTARLNIYGPPYIRSIGSIRAVAGREMIMYCPYSGYPINSVKWERPGGAVSGPVTSGAEGSLIINRVESSHAGTYTCIVTSTEGQQARREIQVVVNNPPEIEPFSFPGNLQEGRRAQVSCSVTSGDMPVYFSWYKDGLSIPASLQVEERGAEFFSNLVFKDVSSRHSGLYTCVASNSAAKVNYTAELVVKVPPKWISEPQDTATLAGGTLSLHCRTRGSPAPQITWLKQQGQVGSDFIPLVNLGGRFKFMSNGTLLIEGASSYDEGQYMCKADNAIGTPLSKIITVSVNEPARFEMTSRNITARRNEPITLICDVIGDNPIQIQWTHNMNRLDLNTYRLSMSEVKTDSGLRSQLFISRTDRQDSGVYKCQAVNPFGHSDHMIYLSVQERPDAPQSLVVLEVGSRSARLGWSQGFDGNSPLLGYSVQYALLHLLHAPIQWDDAIIQNISFHSLIKGQNKNNIISSSDEASNDYEAVVTALQPHNSYAMRIQAINQIEHSQFTEPVIVKTQEEAPSEAPHNLQIQTAGPGELHVNWQAPSRETWNGDLLGYTLTWYELTPGAGIMNTSRSATVNGWSSTELTLTGLKKFTRYGITIKAFNGIAAGPSSIPATATTQEGVPEAPPLSVSCAPLSSVSVKVSWRPPPIAQHGGLIQGYKVLYIPQLDDHVEYHIGEVKRISTTETYLHALHKYTNYSIQVLAYTNAGDGKRSVAVFCTTEEDVPSPPQKIKALAINGDSILVSWLPPQNPNGIISHFTVYYREAGRIGKHTSHIVSVDSKYSDFLYEINNLAEHQLYEFWVSATTGPGEGESTPIITQGANARAPSRIASFSQTIRKPVGSQISLSCRAVGNPSPRARWLHRSVTITHAPHYQVSPQGNLNIHKLDTVSSGNFTCSASNPYGEDSITYTVIAILPPSPAVLGLQYTTASTIKVHWQPPNDGGSPILGYSLLFKPEYDTTWQTVELSPEVSSHALESLKCGTLYMIKLQAHNRVGIGSMSEILSTSTRGSVPRAPKVTEFVNTNATAIKLNLYTWRDGGCAVYKIRIEYRAITDAHWTIAADGPMIDNLVLGQLTPAQWYQLKLAITNDAGTTHNELNVDTTKENGGRIPPLDPSVALAGGGIQAGGMSNSILLPAASAALLLAALSILGCLLLKTRRLRCLLNNRYSRDDRKLSESNELEREKLREGQKLYSSSSINGNEKSNDDSSELYEISPYATFGAVTGVGVRNSGGEHALHFRTFGMPENEAGPARLPTSHRKHRRLHRCDTFEYDESTLSKAMTVEMRGSHFGGGSGTRSVGGGKSLRNSGGSGWDRRKHRDPPTTDSDENSDSPGNTATKGSRCASPMSGERSYTPGRLQMARCSR